MTKLKKIEELDEEVIIASNRPINRQNLSVVMKRSHGKEMKMKRNRYRWIQILAIDMSTVNMKIQ
jgi:hypothetical protein